MQKITQENIVEIELILIEKTESKLLILIDSKYHEIKKFIYKIEQKELHEALKEYDDEKESIVYFLKHSRYFREYIILLGLEDSDIQIANIAFKFNDKKYDFSYLTNEDILDDCTISNSRDYILEELGWYAGDGIYDFDDYEIYIGFDKENLDFKKES